MRSILIFIAAIFSTPLFAAPIWVERSFVPKSDLIDVRFLKSDEESTIIVDHTPWAILLSEIVVEGDDGINRVRYGTFSEDQRATLDSYIEALSGVDPATLSKAAQLAFWINLYNAETIALILDNYALSSIRDIDAPWDQPVTVIDGIPLSLNDIEHRIIRPVFNDPRIHYAVNCASIGCPNLAADAYTGENIEEFLTMAARAYVNHPRGISVDKGRITASKIYGWYRDDFGDNDAEILSHIRAFAAPALLERLQDKKKISRYRYDWDLNEAK